MPEHGFKGEQEYDPIGGESPEVLMRMYRNGEFAKHKRGDLERLVERLESFSQEGDDDVHTEAGALTREIKEDFKKDEE